MGNVVQVDLNTEDAQTVRAWQRSKQNIEEFVASVGTIGPTTRTQDQAVQNLQKQAEKLRNSLVTPQSEYAAALRVANQLLNAQEISEGDYAAAVEKAKQKLDSQDESLQSMIRDASKLRASLVTPQQEYQQALTRNAELLKANQITEDEYAQAVERAKQKLDAQDVTLQNLKRDADQLRASLVTPQEKYAAAIARANQMLNAQEISEAEYEAAVNKAKDALDGQNTELQEMIRLAAQVKHSVVTPQEKYNETLSKLDRLLKAGKISQVEYNRAVNQAAVELRNATAAQDQFKTAGQQAHANMQSALEGTALKVMGIGAAYKLVTDGIQMAVAENVKFNAGIQSAVDLLAEQELKLQIQGGMLPAEVEAQMPQIQKALQATPAVDVGKAIAIQTQTASSGFKAEDVASGAALDATLQLMAATNEFGQRAADPKQSMQSISMYLKGSQNQAPSADMILKTGGKLATIFKESDVQFQDLEQLAKKAAGLTQAGLSESEQLSAFSVVRDVFGAEKGATGLSGFVTRTSTAAATKERVKALKSAGLKPQDVDIAKGGDQLIPTLEKISAAMHKMTAEQQNIFLNEMYGEEVQNQAAFLLKPENIQKLKDRVAAQDNSTILKDNVETFRGSRFARNQGIANAKVFAERKIDQDRGGTTWKEYREAADAQRAQMQAEGTIGGARRTFGAITGGAYAYAAEGLGFAPPTIESMQEGRVKGDANSPMEQAIQTNAKGKAAIAERTLDAAVGKEAIGGELVPLLKEIAKNTANPPPVKQVRQNNQPVKPRPSEALAAPGGR